MWREREEYPREREREGGYSIITRARKYSSLRAIYKFEQYINDEEKGVRLIAKQGKSTLTLSYGYMNLFIAYEIVRDNVIA